jgi:ankyrin repeat protein
MSGGTPKAVEELVWAVKDGNADGVKQALQDGADINAVCDGRTALHCACYAGSVDMTTLLLDNKADPNVEVDGGTPLHDACERGYVEVVKVLLARGADINKSNEVS